MKDTNQLVCIIGIGMLIGLSLPGCDNKGRIVDIDGCEYIRSAVYGGYTFTHKANCTNDVHKKTTP